MAFIIMVFFALTGLLLFSWFNFTIGSFKIMGGLFLFRTAWLMLQGEGKVLHPVHSKSEISLVPLAIPLISGPGTIVTTVVLFSQTQSTLEQGMLLAAIGIVIFITYYILRESRHIMRIVHDKGIRVLNKLMGLILGSIAVQFVINGIIDTLPLIMKAIS